MDVNCTMQCTCVENLLDVFKLVILNLLCRYFFQPDFWQDEKFPPAHGPRLDVDPKRGDNEQSVTQPQEDGDGGSGGDFPEEDSEHPSWAPDFMPDEPGVPHSRPGKQMRRHRGPPRRRWLNRKNPGVMDKVVFTPTFKADNVTFQNTTTISLKEGENIFLMSRHGRGGPHHHRVGKHGPPENVQYVKLIYNTTEPNKVSIEYGVLKPVNLSELAGGDDNSENADW
ncbi:uncharacterized protein LOC108896486 isoform X1 [Lates calcarifer]|uniref:Uncharacterized protein LOC108896486 isoform X1 n=1 Tax=Lates calcarifer TaxID=8187 RepID=A0AAJ8B5Y3_LATCA|nr:uncharacterized protein LOC108896486 isoform X1 [Lates calcarifer]